MKWVTYKTHTTNCKVLVTRAFKRGGSLVKQCSWNIGVCINFHQCQWKVILKHLLSWTLNILLISSPQRPRSQCPVFESIQKLRWREPASKFCQCCSAFRPLLVVEPFDWHYLNSLFASSYQAWTVASHLYYMTGCLPKHIVTIHSNYFDTGLAAVSTKNSLGNS